MSDLTRTLVLDREQKTAPGTVRYNGGLFRSLVSAKLAGIKQGSILLIENGERHVFGNASEGIQVTIHVNDPSFYRAIALGGSLGAAESYLEGHWQCDDLTRLFRLFIQNRRAASGIEKTLSGLQKFRDKLVDLYNRNTLSGSKRNIRAHYDLSNEFFQLWLDPTMTYSSGIFLSEDATMEEASIEKLDRICRKLDLHPGDNLLEIGTGWGSFSIHAAKNYGCRVTTTTISDEQYALAVERIREAELEDRITVLNEDYRNLEGTYDKIVSIEMIEAVGHRFIPEFVRTLNRLLKPGGTIAIQGITMNDRHYEGYRKSVDFIKKYIFPGGNLVSINYLFDTISKHSDLRPTGLEEIGLHYAETLRRWRQTFETVLPEIRGMGFDERFIRMWRFYLTYCEAGFMEKHIGTVQLTFEKP